MRIKIVQGWTRWGELCVFFLWSGQKIKFCTVTEKSCFARLDQIPFLIFPALNWSEKSRQAFIRQLAPQSDKLWRREGEEKKNLSEINPEREDERLCFFFTGKSFLQVQNFWSERLLLFFFFLLPYRRHLTPDRSGKKCQKREGKRGGDQIRSETGCCCK